MLKIRIIASILVPALLAGEVRAGQLGLATEELLFSEVTSVVSKYPESLKQAPGILTVITKEDIRLNHARDLVDVMNMIPGFNVVRDQNTLTQVVARGFIEDKILF